MTTKSPNLGVVSKEGDINLESIESRQERRRLPRLNLAGEQFRHSRMNKIFSVADLSHEGMALRLLEREDIRHFPVATRFEGTLNLHGLKYEVNAVVRHLGVDLVGCQFQELAPKTREAIEQFLDPAILGSGLKPIPAPEMGSIWYRGPSGTSLFLWRHTDGQFHKIGLFFLGNFVQWSDDDGLTTGRARNSEELGEVRGIMRFETMLLATDQKPDKDKLGVAKTLLMSSTLPQDLKKWCLRHLSGE